MKVIAFYLPQFHRIPENDLWWGEGFTEWVNVKSSKQYHEDQYQPREPLNDNYYNLLDVDVLEWQTSIAKQYGIYGFCFYHYWFNGHLLLEKPIEKYKSLPNEKKIKYCLCWANENWTKAWADKTNEVLIQQQYGGKSEWKDHFEYFLPFFKDDKYIKEGNKPLLVIYRPELIYNVKEMMEYWNQLAIQHGFSGISFTYQQYSYFENHGKEEALFSHNIEYQPAYTIAKQAFDNLSFKSKIYHKSPDIFRRIYVYFKGKNSALNEKQNPLKRNNVFDYDDIWNKILNADPTSNKAIPGAFIDFDNSPRRKEQGSYFKNVSIEKFGSYFKQQIIHAREKYNSDYLFLFAWNEWGESAYLEPDKVRGYKPLELIKQALVETDELEFF